MEKRVKCLLTIFTFITLFFYGYASATPFKVALTPFKINAEQDMSFLQNGIYDMLASRLAQDNKFIIIEKGLIKKTLASGNYDLGNEKKEKKLGNALGADYLIAGSITIFGSSVSIDARMIDVSGKKETVSFSKQSENKSRIIPEINMFANKIYASLFGKIEQEEKKETVSNSAIPADTSNIHPEKLFKKSAFQLYSNTDDQDDFFTGLGPTAQSSGGKFWKSSRFIYRINGAAIGDINNDNFVEIVLISGHDIFVYKADGTKLIKIDTIDTNKHRNHIAVDIADINNNGTPEIFVSSLNTHKSSVASSVYEWNGNNYVEIVKDSDWYYRVVNTNFEKTLYGQEQKAGSDQFEKPIYQLAWNGSDYVSGQKILVEKTANVLGIALSNQKIEDSDSLQSIISYDISDKVQITNSFGKELWKSGVSYGGGMLYLEKKTSGHDPYAQSYFPTRIDISDINNDGKEDVILIKNYQPQALEMLRYRKYIATQLFAFSWDGAGFAPMGKTRKITGRISDFAIGDFDNDGKDEIMAVLIAKEGDLIGTNAISFLIAFDL